MRRLTPHVCPPPAPHIYVLVLATASHKNAHNITIIIIVIAPLFLGLLFVSDIICDSHFYMDGGA